MNTTRTLVVLAAAAATTLALAGCTAGDSGTSMEGMDHGNDSTESFDAAAAFDDADVMFAQMMIPHHEQAVEMSDTVLAIDGVGDRVIALAEQIKDAQQPEIDQLEAWLDEWGAGAGDSDGMADMGHGDGMMTADDLASLEAATGDDASRLFLEQMIVHHEGAIDMAEAEVADGEHAGAVEMARSIVETQAAEIDEMRDILATL
ncbi:Uncharacterized conserved protein, DUF305 family [Agromyces sp. CF514]|uniref:DUF305 domain-containing protein n=1 Tax=Agromyces sp. CF514 TaxID=1881031 RepID=UPI0008EC15DE|nr:DUF305 domain-containing protein [Agromyces sp. CF514]SFR67736.1 Uncharacterized conserved protein, DUF305 family [Agromyces sp. CF514]